MRERSALVSRASCILRCGNFRTRTVLPYLHLGWITLPTFGLFVSTGLICACFLMQADLRRRSLSADPYTIIGVAGLAGLARSEEHTSELQSLAYLVCRLLLEKKKHHSRDDRRFDRLHAASTDVRSAFRP